MPIDRGCVYSKDIQFKFRSTGQPVDITTWQFESFLKDESGTTALHMTTSAGQFTVFDGPNGWLRLSMTEAESNALTAGRVAGVLYRTDGSRRRYGSFTDIVRDPE